MASLVASSSVWANEPLRPTSKWNVNYDMAQCIASRNYGVDDDPLMFVLKPSPFGNVMRVVVIKTGPGSSRAKETQATVQFDEQPNIRAGALKYNIKGLTAYSFTMSMQDFTARQQAKKIRVSAQSLDRIFALESVPAVLAELEKCRVDLLRMYNSDGSGIREPAQPEKRLENLYSGWDYPSPAVENLEQGTVTVSLLIDEAGKVKDCSVDGSAGAVTLDAMTCYVIQERASFKPAIGTDGKPARSVFTQKVTWRIN